MSRRIFLTLPDGIGDALEAWAEKENNKSSALASYLLEKAVREAIANGEAPKPAEARTTLLAGYKKLKGLLLDNLEGLKSHPKLGDRITEILAGDELTELDRARIANYFRVEESEIDKLDEEMSS